MKQALKIKLKNHAEFKQAWDALIKAGYHCGSKLVPHTAPYLYAYADGKILADFFDVEGADLSSPNSAAGYFAANDHKEITLEDLQKLTFQENLEQHFQKEIDQIDSEINGLKEKIIEENYFSSDEEEQLEAMITKAIQFGMLCAKRDAYKDQQEQVGNEKYSSTTN